MSLFFELEILCGEFLETLLRLLELILQDCIFIGQSRQFLMHFRKNLLILLLHRGSSFILLFLNDFMVLLFHSGQFFLRFLLDKVCMLHLKMIRQRNHTLVMADHMMLLVLGWGHRRR